MKVDVKKIDTLKREVKFEIPRERVSKTMDEVYEEIGKYAKVRGFRPGKVPRAVLANSHGKLAEEETIKKLVPQAYQEGIGQHQLNPIDLPQISDVALKDGILSFKATLDIRPEVKPGHYKGIKVTRKSSKVSEEDINKTLEFFKKGRDGAETVIDDAFARGMGFPNLEDFKQALSRQLELDKDRQNRVDVENQVIDALIKNARLVVPQSLVQRQLQHRLNETLKRLKSQGMKDEEIRKKEAEITASLQTMVERDVKVYLILEEIAKQEKIGSEQQENLPAKVMEFLLKEAKWESDLLTQV
ncbi:MAG TPA: trigger factor [Candidatus Omnitrophota bacterium]|nr:trigger factor [Candidatus Omnitrophota bacterium]